VVVSSSASSKPLISAALIVRNEERHLDACLSSIEPLVDEVSLVDTGSTDRTMAIAEAHGVDVLRAEWPDDFAEARNWSLERATGEWILYIDADERLIADDRAVEAARRRLAKNDLAAAFVTLRAHRDYGAYRELRLFRNHPSIRFEGIIHENIWPAIDRYRARTGRKIIATDLLLDHVGYEGDQDHKHERNRPLLLRELERNPTHLYSLYHLGVVERARGDFDAARRHLRAAMAAGKRHRPPRATESLSWVELAQIELAEDTPESRQRAKQLIVDGLARFPKQASLEWLHATTLMHSDDTLDAANKVLLGLLNRPLGLDADLGFDRRLFGLFPAAALARNYFRLGRFDEAKDYFALAEQYDPNSAEYRVKRQLCESLMAKESRTAIP
jgi:tetratricopeptide (TPR) repeat protein